MYIFGSIQYFLLAQLFTVRHSRFKRKTCPFLLSFLVLQTVYEGNELNHAFGLCHYNNFLFWNEYRSGSIYKLDQITKTVTLLRNERPPIFEIRMYDAQQQQGIPQRRGLPASS